MGKLWIGVAFCGLLGAATIEKVAGGDQPPGGPANVTSIDKPIGVVFDQDGNWYIAEWHRNRIVKVDKKGITSIFAGTGDSIPGDHEETLLILKNLGALYWNQ